MMDLRLVNSALLVLILPALTAALAPTYFISAPNVIRVGVDETIVINILGAVNAGAGGVPVTVKLQNYPARTTTYATQTVNVRKNDPKRITLQVSPDDVVENTNPDEPEYVYLHASSQSAAIQIDEGTPVLLSYKAGYTFIQTDKPIYTPNQEVFIRLIAVDQQMRPSQEKVRIDILTPQDIIVKRFDDLTPDAGFVSVNYKFPLLPAFGNWTVAAYYGHEMKHNTTVQFFVKEYTLPTYSVKISVLPTKYVLPSQREIQLLIKGEYVFGENVQGFYRIKYRLMDSDGNLQMIKDNINGTLNEHGEADHSLMISDILGDNDFDDILGKRLHIEAFIIESATGTIESSNNTVLQFVDSPFKFKWDHTLKYFKTNLPFEVKADVVYCYGDPVPNLNVRVSAVGRLRGGGQDVLESPENLKQTNNLGRVGFSLNVQQGIEQIDITMTTEFGGQLANFEQIDTFTVLPFNPGQGNNELLIRPSAQGLVSVSDSISVDLQRSGGAQENVDAIFTYVVAGGKITQEAAIEEVIANTVTNIQITQDMVPSARLVAFYVNDNNQVVADALWLDVEDECENPVEVTVPDNSNGRTYYMPGDTVQLTLRGKPQTKIGLLAVDSAVYLLKDYHRLNQKKVFARMASYDLGCGPGGGRDTQDIFKNAGITVITNAQLQTQEREGLSCEEHNRRRRSVPVGEEYNIEDLTTEYEGNATLLTYCVKGQVLIEDWTCTRRAQGLATRKGLDRDHPYVEALFKCCVAVSQAGGRSAGGPQLPAPKVDFGDVQIRSNFPESWLFKDELVDLGDHESKVHNIPLPHSITTWIIQAVGVSPLHGMCVADNKEIVARREYFIDVAVPYSVMRHEQVAIQATMFNYDENGHDTRVTLMMEGVDGLCSNARPGEFVTKEGVVAAGQAKSFSFIVIPLEVQDYDITIHMFSNFGNDAVRKTLHVVPEGTRQVQPLSIVLDPAGIGQEIPQNENNVEVIDHGLLNNLDHMQLHDQPNRNQIDTVSLTMPDDAIPNTAKCEVNLIGSLLGPVASAVIDGLDGGAFLNKPRGCGEQTMIYTAPNVYIYKYLKTIGKDTPDIEKKAIQNMESGYSREVNHYRDADGAFKTFDHTPGNSWLTAFVLRVFCKAKEFITVDKKVICEGMSWLADRQKPDGSFDFTTRTYHGSHFMGGVDEPIPLTAFVLIALSECNCDTLDTTQTKSQATMYLESKLAEISQDEHTLAIVTYALALVNSAQANNFNAQLKTLAHSNAAQGTKYFGQQGGGALTVETTAYALLAQITLGEISYSFPIVQWLMLQRNQIGNWYSTQDTMVSLQALSEYAQRAHTGDIDLTCDVTSSVDARLQTQWEILPENAFVLQATQAPVEGDLVFETHGVGIATLSVNLHYYKASGNDNQCPFEVVITPTDMKADPPKPGAPDEKPKKKLKIQVCAKYTGTGNTNMAIIDVGLLSGFTPITKTLIKVTEDTPLIQFYEVTDRSVVFYAESIPAGDNVQPLCVTFEAYQEFEIGNVQPVAVKVYDYYLPERECIKFYRPDGNSPVLETICDDQGDACQCAAASCLNMDPELKLQVPKLKALACETVEHFAYKTTFVEKQLKDTYETFIMEVTPLKTGLENVRMGQLRQFWKSINCKHPIIEAGNDYLIVGKGGIPIKDQNGATTEYRHFVDSGFTVIHWPNDVQLRQEEKNCKSACANNACKRACRDTFRPAENERRAFFQGVEQEFITGCPT